MEHWQEGVVDRATEVDFAIQNLLVEGAPIACEEALGAARRLCDCLSSLSLGEAPAGETMVSNQSEAIGPHAEPNGRRIHA